MINILVVDDEPISADGISIYLESHGDPQWNIMTAYNSVDAIHLAQQRIDVLLTDIMMPGMNGFTLQEQMCKRWPRLRTVFLTGNGSMNDAQQAIRSENVVDYVLKIEDESVVLAAIRKAVADLEDETQIQDTLRQAQQDFGRILPMLQKECIMSVLKGKLSGKQLAERFLQVELPLRSERPVLMLISQLSESISSSHMNDIAFLALEGILEKQFYPIYRFFALSVTEKRIVVLIQSRSTIENIDVQQVFLLLESVQQAFQKAVGEIAFVLDHAPRMWSELYQHYRAMILTLEKSAYVSDDMMVIRNHNDHLPEMEDVQELLKLRALLEQAEYDRMSQIIRGTEVPETATGRMMLYRQWLKLFSMAVEGRPDAETFYNSCRIPYPNMDQKGFSQVRQEFAALFGSLTKDKVTPYERKAQTVETMCSYIESHLSEDLSLARMAEIVYHSSTYVSKLFTEVKGIGYNNYVVSQRLSKAAELLQGSRMRLEEIVEAVGYRSTSYFIYAFRNRYSMTPAEYRKKYRK